MSGASAISDVESVIITKELDQRLSRAADYQAETLALASLADAMVSSPDMVLQRLVEVAMKLTRSDSAGISILEPSGEQGTFRWVATAGAWSDYRNATMRREASPCGEVIAREAVLLMKNPERLFPALLQAEPNIGEALLAPFHLGKIPVGTLWTIKHSQDGHFDAEDARLLKSLARFAAAAHQTVQALQSAQASNQQAEVRSKQLLALADVSTEFIGICDLDFMPIYGNAAAMRMVGLVDLEQVKRTPLHEFFFSEDRAFITEDFFQRVLREGQGKIEIRFRHFVTGEPIWVDYSLVVLKDETGRATGLGTVTHDLTERKQSEAILRANEEWQAFLLQLSDALRPIGDPLYIQNEAMRVLGEHLGVNRAQYHEVQHDDEWLVAGGGYANGVELHANYGRMDEFGAFVKDAYRAGRTLVSEDSDADQRISNMERAAFNSIGVRAFVAVPLNKDGRLVAVLGLDQKNPRQWSQTEIALAEETAERTWAAVERARAETALRKSEKRNALLLKLSDTLRPLRDPLEVQKATMRLVVENLGVMRASYFKMDADEDGFTLAAHYDNGAPPLPGHMRISDFAPDMAEGYRRGRTFVINDAEIEALTESERAAYRDIGVRAGVGVPLVKDGILLGIFGVHSATLRRWSGDEIQLLEDVADRIWTTVDRAQSEAMVHESEERFQQFSDAATNVLWIRDIDTMRMEFASPAFEKIYGIPGVDRGGDADLSVWSSLVEPEHRETVLGNFDRVRAGERVEQEFRIRRPTDGELRWIHDTTFPLRDENGHVQYFAGLGADITDIKEATDRQGVLVAELQHRTRNLIAVIRALANRTLSNAASLEDFKVRFGLRLSALSRVQGLLSHLSTGEKVTFKELLNSELAVYGATDGMAHKFTLEGPDDVPLRSRTVQTFALALHELATNAIKYGALAVPDGHLFVGWRVEYPGGKELPRLHVEWRESGVTMPEVGAPAKGSGYGRELIERALPYQLQAKTTYEMGIDGVRCTIVVPISQTASDRIPSSE